MVGNTVQIAQADGTNLVFNRDPSNPSLCNTSNPSDGQIEISGNAPFITYRWHWTHGAGSNIASSNPNSGDVTAFTPVAGRILTFNQAGKLQTIAAATGEAVSLDYNPKNGQLRQVTDPQGRRLNLYNYSGQRPNPNSSTYTGIHRIVSPVGTHIYSYGAPLPIGADPALKDAMVSVLNAVTTIEKTATASDKNNDKNNDKANTADTNNSEPEDQLAPVAGTITTRHYHYEDPRHPTLLSGISLRVGTGSARNLGYLFPSDPKNTTTLTRLNTWLYDAQGRAALSVKGHPARLARDASGKIIEPKRLEEGTGIEQIVLDWNDQKNGATNQNSKDKNQASHNTQTNHNNQASPTQQTVTLTNSLGQDTFYTYTVIKGQYRLTSSRGPGCASCGPANIRYDYAHNGQLVATTSLDTQGQAIQTSRSTLDTLGRLVKVETIDYVEVGSSKSSKKIPQPAQLQIRYEYAVSAGQTTAQTPPANRANSASTDGNTATNTQASTDSNPASNPAANPQVIGAVLDQPTLIARPSVIPGQEHQLHLKTNPQGQLTEVTETGYSPATDAAEKSFQKLSRTTTYRYTKTHNRSLLTQTDGPLPNGPTDTPQDSDITVFEWNDTANHLTKISAPMNLQTTFKHDHLGRVIEQTGIDGVATVISYQPSGAINRISRAGADSQFEVNALGQPTRLVDPAGQQIQFGYDAAGCISSVADLQNNRIQLAHTTEGRLQAARLNNPDGSLAAQLPTQSNDPVTDAAGRDAVLAGVTQLISSAAPSSNIARPAINPNPYAALQAFFSQPARQPADSSAISTATDHNGKTTTYLHNDFGALIQVQSPTTGTSQYQYDPAGRLIARISADTSRSAYRRDAAGRVIGVTAKNPQGHLDEDATITWGPANKPSTIRYLGKEYFSSLLGLWRAKPNCSPSHSQ